MASFDAMDFSGITLTTDGRGTGFYNNGELVGTFGNDGRGSGFDGTGAGGFGRGGNFAMNDRIRELMAQNITSTYYDFEAQAKNNNIRYGMSYTSFDDLLDAFDISRLPDMDGITMPLVGHIIVTRPSLYVSPNSGGGVAGSNYSAMLNNPMTAMWVSDRYGKKITSMLSEFSPVAYMPVFTNRAMSYSVGDVAIKTLETGETYYGHMIKYGHHTEDHKLSNTISIDFRNDRYLSILKAIYIWMAYIAITSKSSSIKPSDTSQKNGILDYCGSIYYLVTQMDMSRLVYWEKLTGVFPKSVPLGSIFSYNDAPIVEDKLTVEFEYGMRSDPCDLNVLMDLNVLSSDGGSYMQAANYMLAGISGQVQYDWRSDRNIQMRSAMQRPDSFERPFGLGNALSSGPVVRAARDVDGSIAYFLEWRRY